MKINKQLLADSVVEFWKVNCPGYGKNLSSLPPAQQRAHYRSIKQQYVAIVEGIELSIVDRKRTAFAYKCWLKYFFPGRLSVAQIARRYKVPKFIVRFFIEIHGFNNHKSVNEKIRWILFEKLKEKPNKQLNPQPNQKHLIPTLEN